MAVPISLLIESMKRIARGYLTQPQIFQKRARITEALERYRLFWTARISLMFKSELLMSEISKNNFYHASDSSWYQTTQKHLEIEVSNGHGPSVTSDIYLGEVGKLIFPFYSMGNVSSRNLFGLDELILFSFYFENRNRYTKVLDLANIGLHSLVLLKLGFTVVSYEPDPSHISQIKKVLHLNGFSNEGIVEAAISNSTEPKEFVRVLGNTTGSHLLGAKEGLPYGGHDTFTVSSHALNDVLEQGYDLIKMDVEGHEAALIQHLDPKFLDNTDILLEVGSEENAKKIFSKMSQLEINLFSQKNNWRKVKCENDLPTSYKEGSLFISKKPKMLWTN
jgi:FkbM family methyltransferase